MKRIVKSLIAALTTFYLIAILLVMASFNPIEWALFNPSSENFRFAISCSVITLGYCFFIYYNTVFNEKVD